MRRRVDPRTAHCAPPSEPTCSLAGAAPRGVLVPMVPPWELEETGDLQNTMHNADERIRQMTRRGAATGAR